MKYIEELDGLRALAVLAVLLFHFGVEELSGGYAGVDIFFVISGYLISSIILHEMLAGQFSFIQFYEKRIRRLFPALLATVFTSLLVAYALFMPDEFVEFGQSMVSATLYISNIFFWLKSDYFAGPSELKPLLHTWSLSVEEQFYLIFPVIAWLSIKQGLRGFLIVTLSIFLVSFLAAIVLIDTHSSAVFFLSPFRFWELLLGTLLAISVKCGVVPKEHWKAPLGYTGLVFILVPLFILDEQSQFPGIAAIPSCLGTAMLILAGKQASLVGQFLRLPVMRFTGKISYSLYLWHWPLVVFYGYWAIREFTWWDKVAMFVVTYVLGWLSWRFFEQPFRLTAQKNYAPRRVFGVTFVSSCLMLAAGLLIWKQDGMPGRYPNINVETLTQSRQHSHTTHCFLSREQDFNLWSAEDCLIDSPKSANKVLLWGDSHAYHLLAGLNSIAANLPFDVLVYTSAGCPPVLNQYLKGRPNCMKNNDFALTLLDKYDIQQVILAGNWAYAQHSEDLDVDQLRETVAKLYSKNVKVTVLTQLPLYPISNPQYLAARLAQREQPKRDFYMKPEEGLATRNRIIELIPQNNLFDAYGLFCPKDQCKIFSEGNLMVIDRGHLSAAGSRFLVNHFFKQSNLDARSSFAQ